MNRHLLHSFIGVLLHEYRRAVDHRIGAAGNLRHTAKNLVVTGVVVACWLALREDSAANVVAAAVSVTLFAFLVWYFFAYSMYAPRGDRPRVGARFPDFRLPSCDGAVFELAAGRGKRHLLIFYRGSW